MTQADDERGTTSVQHGRGRPRVIDRDRIVEAAIEVGREVGLAELSMTSVAERLGVHRSALNYHVRNREELVELVATAVVDYTMNDRWAPADDADWRDWVRAFATELRRVLLAHSPLALYFRFPPGPATGGLEQVDRFLGRLTAAGFEVAGATKAFTYVAQVVFMGVRDELMAAETGRHPQDLELARVLEGLPDGELPNIRASLDAGGRAEGDEQFGFNLACTIAGLEAVLATRADNRRPPPRRRTSRAK